MKGFNSKLVHGNIEKNKDIYGALRMPVYDCAAFEYNSAEEIAEAFAGKREGHTYSRITNPTVEELEKRIAYVSDAESVLCLSSGMAAIANTIISVCSAGDNIITSNYIFGNTYSLFETTLKSLGIETRFVNLENEEEIKSNIDNKTRVIFTENITNPHLIVFDIEKISKIAEEKDILLIVDNTLMTNYLFKAKEYNVDIEIISTTKIISGGGTSVGGAVIIYDSNKWNKIPKLKDFYEKYNKNALMKKLKKETYRNFGACLSPHNAYLQILGMETMTLRMDRSCENTLKIANFLEKEGNVKAVNYPGLKNNKFFDIVNKQFKGVAGSLLTFELYSKEQCFKFLNKFIFCCNYYFCNIS